MKELMIIPIMFISYIVIGLAVRFIAFIIDWLTNNKYKLGYWMDTEGYENGRE